MPKAVPGLVRFSSLAAAVAALRTPAVPSRLPTAHLGQSEIQNLGVSALGDEDVSGLDVAVDNAFGMGCVERIRNVDAERQ